MFQGAYCSISLQRAFHLISAQGTESFVLFKYSMFYFVFIPDNITWQVRILGGGYKCIILPRKSFYDRRVGSPFQVGARIKLKSGYPWFFSLCLHTQVKTGCDQISVRFVVCLFHTTTTIKCV